MGLHDRLGDQAASYVLGALTPAERQAFEAHLAGCTTCAAEVRSLTPVAAATVSPHPHVSSPRRRTKNALPYRTPAAPPQPHALLASMLQSPAPLVPLEVQSPAVNERANQLRVLLRNRNR